MHRLLKNIDTTAKVSSVGWGKRTIDYGGLDDGGHLCHLSYGVGTEEHGWKTSNWIPRSLDTCFTQVKHYCFPGLFIDYSDVINKQEALISVDTAYFLQDISVYKLRLAGIRS